MDSYGEAESRTTLVDRLALLRRRRKPALTAFLAVLALTLVVAFAWPPTYRAEGTVLIEQQEVPEEFVRAAITSFADQRVRTISQRVMTTANLLEIVNRFDLYPERRRREPREQLLERMRDDIRLDMISADVVDPRQGRPTKATIAFTVGFDSRSPLLAAKVANELTTLFLNENLASRRQHAASTADFLTEEVTRVGTEVADLEQRIASFKDDQGDALPELGQVNIQLLTRAEEELRSVESRLRTLDQQVVYFDTQLAAIDPVGATYLDDGQRAPSTTQRLRALRTQLASAEALYGSNHPDVLRLRREVAGLEREVGAVDSDNEMARQLQLAKSQLAQARNRYSAAHPDVQRLESVVAAIEATMRASTPMAASLQLAATPDNPQYVDVQSRREAAIAEQRALREQLAGLRGRIQEFEGRLARAPAVERDYSALLRDLQSTRAKYQEVRQKQMEAQLASNLESEQKGERFTLIDPPLVPEKPASPNLALVLALGVLLAVGAAAGTAVLLDQVDDSVQGRQDLARLATVPPLAVIPWIETEQDRIQAQRKLRLGLVAVATSVVMLLVLVHFLFRPLDVLWHIILRRLGI
jgi:uncharacterized protein involved in exopolysaccharide biosynthesis